MGALVITAVDNTTDTITSVAHGLNTGDGPGAMFVGVGGVIPTGLTAAADTWAIRVDADHFKVASSSANALSNTPINITANGTLPLTYGIGLPYRRARTYAVLQQIKSADLDGLQDDDAALYAFLVGNPQSVYSGIVLASGQHVQLQGAGMYKRGTRVRHIPGNAGILISTPSAGVSYYSQTWFAFKSAFPDTARWSLVLEEGEQLQSVRAYVSNGATDVLKMTLFKNTSSNLVIGAVPSAEIQVGAQQTSANHVNQLEQLAITGLTENIGNGIVHYAVEVKCTAFANAPVCYGIDYTTII